MRANSVVFAVIGLGLLAIAAYVLDQKVLFWYHAEAVTASVVGYEVQSPDLNYGSETVSHAVLAFTSPKGQLIEVTAPSGIVVPRHRMGEQVRLRFNPAQPHQVEFPDFFSRWGALLLSVVLALMGTVTLWVVLAFSRSTQQPANGASQSWLRWQERRK